MVRRRGQGSSIDSLLHNLKDYIVPIIAILLIFVLIYSFFFSGNGDKKQPTDLENRKGIPITLETSANASIYYKGGKEKAVDANSKLYMGEKLVVKDGRASIANDAYAFKINKLGELEYVSDGKFTIQNGSIWLDTKRDVNLKMKFSDVHVSKNSHLSFTQTEVSSTVYLISGMAEVKNKSGKSLVLAPEEKIEISRQDASDENIDLSLKKEKLGDFFLDSEWFTLNNGASYLGIGSGTTETASGNGEIQNTTSLTSENNYLTFGNLVDASNVSSSSINIYGNYSNEGISKIVVNNTNTAKINKQNKSFNFESVDVSNKVNDLVFKVYDSGNSLIGKFVYTVYYNGYNKSSGTKATNNKVTGFTVKNYDVDANDFVFTSPNASGKYTTYETFVTIKGAVKSEGVDRVTVNDYRLNSFNGKTWRYHARQDYGNLVDGANRYEIKYFSGSKLVYKNYYTITKKTQTKKGGADKKPENPDT